MEHAKDGWIHGARRHPIARPQRTPALFAANFGYLAETRLGAKDAILCNTALRCV